MTNCEMPTMSLLNCSTIVMNDHSPFAAMNCSPSPELSFSSSAESSQEANMIDPHVPMGTFQLQYLNFGIPTDNGKPFLKILEEPVEKFRFRYKSEMMGTHGSILARSSEKNRRKIYPSVQLCNYDGPAFIRCSLYTSHPNIRIPHTHRLVVRAENNMDKDDPHEVLVSQDCSYTAVFPGMGIIHTAKKHIVEELTKKKRARMLEKLRAKNINISSLSTLQESDIRMKSEKEARDMNLNSVCLCFEAFTRDANNCLQEICDPVYSKPINNMKSALTGELKICRIDRHVSSCMGGEEVFILVEKVGKKNIQIKFFELDDDDIEIWRDYGKFSELDVHHQYAIVFRTPPYRDLEIKKSVDVFVQLYRPSDGDRSEPIRFQYKPCDRVDRTRKRQRVSNEISSINNEQTSRLVMNSTIENVLNITSDPILGNHDGVDLFSETLCEPYENNFTSSEFQEFLKNLSISDLNPPHTQSGCGSVSSDIVKAMKNDLEPACSDFTFCHPEIPFVGGVKMEGYTRDYLRTFDVENPMELASDGESKKLAARKRKEIPMETSDKNESVVEVKKEEQDIDTIIDKCVTRLNEILKENPPTTLSKNLEEIFNEKTEDGENALHIAVIGGEKEKLKLMLSVLEREPHNNIINSRNLQGEIALHLAVLKNEPEFVKMLILRGADPNAVNKNGESAIHLAVENSHDDCLAELLDKTNYLSNDHKPNYNLKNYSGRTPLHLAALKHNLIAVKMLTQAGADVNTEDSSLGRTVLHLAVEENCKDIVEYLVKETKIDVNKPNYEGNIALHLACVVDGGALDICKILLDSKSDPNKSNHENRRKSASPDNIKSVLCSTDEDLSVEIKEEVESEDDLRLDVDDDDDEEDDDDTQGQTSIDLAWNNTEIRNLLMSAGQAEPSSSIKVEVKEECPSPSNESSGIADNGLFDETTLQSLCHILDESKGWVKLADFLDYTFLVPSIRNATSPTKLLLSYTDLHGNVNVQDIRKFLDALDEKQAVEAVDLMLAKQVGSSNDR